MYAYVALCMDVVAVQSLRMRSWKVSEARKAHVTN